MTKKDKKPDTEKSIIDMTDEEIFELVKKRKEDKKRKEKSLFAIAGIVGLLLWGF